MNAIMEIITGLDFHLKNSSVSLGKFDGLHRGHRFLLSRIKKQRELISTAFTFEIGEVPKIYTQAEKNEILRHLGVEREIIFPFREETKNMTAEDFIEKILVERIDARYICVGEDFHFGKDRSGDVDTLRMYQEKYGYEVEVVKKLSCQENIISSTKIREFLKEGNMEMANLFLDDPYFIEGMVLSGEELGRKLSSPTANLSVEKEKILPRFGVYAVVAEVEGKRYFGVTNVGIKPTVGKFPVGVETNLFSFHENIYGQKMKVNFCKFLRDERKFSSLEGLKVQIEEDKGKALQCLQKLYPECKIEREDAMVQS